MATKQPDIIISPSTKENFPQYIELYRLCFPKATDKFTPDYLRWVCLENPEGSFLGADAIIGDNVVGQVSAIPGRYIFNGQVQRGAWAVNAVVHPQYQGRMLLRKIGLKLCELARNDGCNFVVCVANALATPVWTRQVGFSLVTPLEARVGWGSFRPDYKKIMDKTAFRHYWTSEAFQWRCNNPDNPIKLFHENHSNSVTALANSTHRGIYAYACLNNEDLNLELPAESLQHRLLPRVFLGLIPGFSFGMTYLDIPKRLRPSPLNLLYKDLTGSEPPPPPNSFFINYLDLDLF